MITLFVEENNPIFQKSYDNILSNIQFHRLTCTCGHSACLSVHGYYQRFIKLPEGKSPLRICRVICQSCGHTHALLPSSMVPYSQISLSEHVAVVSCYHNGCSFDSVMNHNPTIDESNCRYIIHKYLLFWLQRLLAEHISIQNHNTLIENCFRAFSMQFMQIKYTPNILIFNTT